jgi:hypothetical protein
VGPRRIPVEVPPRPHEIMVVPRARLLTGI